jgi:D-alanyl-D-alanine carboxypeptidase
MTGRGSRLVYGCLLYLHPRAFRQRFGEEMMATFEEASQRQSVSGLLVDGFTSLLRQWLLHPSSLGIPVAEAALTTSGEWQVFAWERINACGAALPAGRWLQGSVMSLVVFTGTWLLAMHAGKRVTAVTILTEFSGQIRDRSFASSSTQSSRSGSMPGDSSEVPYAIGGTSVDVRERQRRQQELAMQTTKGTESAPGKAIVRIESQGVPPPIPKTPAGEQFSNWLREFNGGERTQLEGGRKHFKNPPPQGVEAELGFRRMTGGFELRKIEESTPTRISGLVQERSSDQMARFAMEVEPDAPNLITSWSLEAVPTPAEFVVPRLSEAEAMEAAKARIVGLVQQDQFSGAVLVTKSGKSIFSGAYGMADQEKKIPNSLDTKFRIGSMNKMFTAVSVLQLVQAGKMKLSDPFGKYVTDYPNKDAASKVTIENLLTHTGGTGDIFGPEFEKHRKDLRTLQDYVNLYGRRELEFAPRSRWEYSNYGFILLGVIVERASGKSYYDYVSEKVYGPAGMTSTASLPEDENVPGRSVGYTRLGGTDLHPNTDTLPYRGTSAGGGYSTVEDLQRFASALTNHKLLNAEYTELLTTGKVEARQGSKYAFGFFDEGADSGTRHFGHGGGAPGMNGDLQIYPQSGYVIAVLSNLDPPAASRVAAFIVNRVPKN